MNQPLTLIVCILIPSSKETLKETGALYLHLIITVKVQEESTPAQDLYLVTTFQSLDRFSGCLLHFPGLPAVKNRVKRRI